MALLTLEELNREFLMEANLAATAPLPEQAPGQQAPGQQAPGQQAPEQQAPGQQAPRRQAPGQQAPRRQAPGQQAPEQQAPGRQAPGQQAPGQQAPGRQAPGQQAPSPLTRSRQSKPPGQKKRGVVAILSDILFYTAILAVLFSAVVANPDKGNPRVIMGYSYYTVLTTSMQSEIPKGSFILVRQTDPGELQIGDTITFMRDRSVTVTHKIVGIVEAMEEGEARGFQTKGVNNANPDKEIVRGENVIGKVVLVIPAMGAVISYLNANIFLVFIMYGLCIILSFCIR
ncbi:MAG: signal peptidase I, partial [Clostridiales bacterium]|nr:signal peptidase I [Clostridiales bacterium]